MSQSKVYAANLAAYYEIAPTSIRLAGIGWYSQAHEDCKELAEKYRLPLTHACAIVAALSPRLAWSVNVSCAEKCIIGWLRGLDPSEVPMGAFVANRIKAWTILENLTHDPKIFVGKVDGAPKVRAFYECLLNPLETREVCVDSWMVRAANNDMGRTDVSQKEFKAIALEVALLADREGIPPLAMQAIIWESVRNKGSL